MSMKKRLCNPPGERVAESGDPEVLGMFQGAGEGVHYLEELIEYVEDEEGGAKRKKDIAAALKRFTKEAVTCEAEYVRERKALAAKTVERMHKIFDAVVVAIGEEAYEGG